MGPPATRRDARTQFLLSSAQALLLSSPSTSRYLMREGHAVGSIDPQPSRLTTENGCAACGSLLLPGWTSSTRMISRKMRSSRNDRSDDATTPTRVIKSSQCLICRRVTKQQSEMKVKVKRGTFASSKDATQVTSGHDISLKPSTTLALQPKLSSKQRAKARKDRDGLQALLNRTAQTSSQPSLSFMDMMKR